MENYCPLTMEKERKADELKDQSILILHDDNAAAAASELLEDEECLVIDNEVDFPVDPMKDINNAHDWEQDAEKYRVNNLLEGKDEREEGCSDLKMMEDLNTKGETVTLESDVKGEGSGEEITSQVDELKHVVMEKMNVCSNIHEGKQETNYLPFKKKARDTKRNGGHVLQKEEDDKSDTFNMANMDGGLKKQIPKKRADYKPSCKKSLDLTAQVDDGRKKNALFVLILILILRSLPGAHADVLGAHSNYSVQQVGDSLSCEHYMSELYNYSGPFKERNACIKKQKNTQCKSGLESMCVLYINKDMCYSGCGKRVSMKGTECPMVTHQDETNKYIVQCYPNECHLCTDSDSPEQRLSKCRDLQIQKSSSTRKKPFLWIMVIMAAVFCVSV